jgi:hypothetical protein
MYDRRVRGLPPPPSGGLRYRIETLVGITGMKMAKYRATWKEAISAPFKLLWRPHLLGMLVFEVHLHFTKTVARSTEEVVCTGPFVWFRDWHKRTYLLQLSIVVAHSPFSLLGHQRCFSWLTASRRIRIFPICHCWGIRSAIGSCRC